MAKLPEGFGTITPSIVVNGAARAIELYKKAFGAVELYRMEGARGKIMHACLRFGNSNLFIADTDPQMVTAAPTSSTFYVYVANVDDTFRVAKGAGLKELFPVKDMFWGDRTGVLEDSFGNRWTLATHVRYVTQEEMEEGRRQFTLEKAA